jgi:predicted DNA-binding transcriptional regulator AlpA
MAEKIGIREVERRTGLSHDTVRRLARERMFPAGYRVGKRAVVWDAEEIEAFLQSRRITPRAVAEDEA